MASPRGPAALEAVFEEFFDSYDQYQLNLRPGTPDTARSTARSPTTSASQLTMPASHSARTVPASPFQALIASA